MIPLQLKNYQHISQKEVDLQHHQQLNKAFNSEIFEINYFLLKIQKEYSKFGEVQRTFIISSTECLQKKSGTQKIILMFRRLSHQRKKEVY